MIIFQLASVFAPKMQSAHAVFASRAVLQPAASGSFEHASASVLRTVSEQAARFCAAAGGLIVGGVKDAPAFLQVAASSSSVPVSEPFFVSPFASPAASPDCSTSVVLEQPDAATAETRPVRAVTLASA